MRGNFNESVPGGNLVIRGSGGGGVFRILPRTPFSFPAVAAAGNMVPIVLARFIETHDWVSGALEVRQHVGIPTGGGGSAYLGLWPVSFSEEDPSLDFVNDLTYSSANAIAFVSMTIGNGVFLASPLNKLSGSNVAMTSHLRAVLVASPPTTGSLTFTISADVTGRPSG